MKEYAYVIGRFQGAHNSHFKLFREALTLAKNLVILIGDTGTGGRTQKNPFTYEERVSMLRSGFMPDEFPRISFEKLTDKPTDAEWVSEVLSHTTANLKGYSSVIVGHKKDDSSYYLDLFEMTPYHEYESDNSLSATDIRNDWYKGKDMKEVPVPFGVGILLNSFKSTEWYYILKEKYKFRYHPYKETVQSNTADAVVVDMTKIPHRYLLIERGGFPYKGKLALAGGHKNNNETFLQCAMRELKEETSIDIESLWLVNRVIHKTLALRDLPNRDPVMCKVSQPHLFLVRSEMTVVCKDDAVFGGQEWLTYDEIKENKDLVAFDHFGMITEAERTIINFNI